MYATAQSWNSFSNINSVDLCRMLKIRERYSA